MNGLALDSDEWRDALAKIAKGRGWPSALDPEALGARVRALSDEYNLDARAARDGASLAARLGFSFARDVPKSGAAVRELVQTRLLAVTPSRALRVLDVGAGLGASTWGIARALEIAGQMGEIRATWIDEDERALEVANAILRAAPAGAVAMHATTERRGATNPPNGPFDLVLVGQALSEMDLDAAIDARLAAHVALIERLLAVTSDDGALVIVEPALRDRTRHLHALRDAICARRRTNGASLFAPCLHASPCPALVRDGDWCHEKRPIDLPSWLVPVARAAGLRWEGLSFSYLILRKDGRSLEDLTRLASAHRPTAARFRLVSDRIVTKGKEEAFLCGKSAKSAGRVRARRLDRDASETNETWDTLSRGDLVAIDPAPSLPETIAGDAANAGASANAGEGDARIRKDAQLEAIDLATLATLTKIDHEGELRD